VLGTVKVKVMKVKRSVQKYKHLGFETLWVWFGLVWSCRVNAFLGALYPSKSGLMNKHIVKHIVKHTVKTYHAFLGVLYPSKSGLK